MHTPVLIPFFGESLHPHRIFETLAFFIGFRMYVKLRRKETISEEHAVYVLIGAVLGALIGSTVVASLQDIPALVHNVHNHGFLGLLQGKTIVGGLFGGIIGVEIGKKLAGHQHSTGDDMVLPLAIAMCIGRIGCFLTGLSDDTYGIPTSSIFGIDVGDGVKRHPTSLYDIVFLLSLVMVIRWSARRKPYEGFQFALFSTAYFLYRFGIEWLKPSIKPYVGMSSIQWTCVLGVLYYVVYFIVQKRRMNYAQSSVHLH
ncbi:prolipoprotein diacylglyceryl transferase family protein [Bacillus sp. 165]|uniref:prolipoprotein diacylglyceryl transferase n=1 Tax=Bacillus sp. 165 TaxID=1529117 RepID=UPI001AD98C13|nr:prolipoprotein diacylglyceryl transferase [Bacillus sp. 165]